MEIYCENCGVGLDGNLVCPVCDGKVYSKYHNQYIDLDESIYSRKHQDYFYRKDDLCYSKYYDDYILRSESVEVYNMDTDNMDYVPEDKAVYSSYYEQWLIFGQTVYSFYYDTYLYADPERTAFSKYLDSYIDIGDDDIIYANNDYIPKRSFQKA